MVLIGANKTVSEIEDFENHCWRDIIPAEDYETYKPYRRKTRIGSRPALLAIDLFNLAYKGGARPPHELTQEYPGTCGIFAHKAIEPTQRLIASARVADLPIFYVTGRSSQNRVRSTKRGGSSA